MTAYNPGDIIVSELTVTSHSGQAIDYTKSFVSFDIYESIFAPGIIAYITVSDAKDNVGDAKIAGGEQVSIAFSSPGQQPAQYKLLVNSVKDGSAPPGQHSKSYRYECVSEEAFNARDKYVSKKYDNKNYSEMIQDIFKNFIKSSKKLDVEDTKGMFKHVVPNQKPYHAIDYIRRRCVSPENKSSSYVFFENRDGFFFKTIEQIFKDKNIIKTYVQDATTGADFMKAKGNNILAVEVPQQGSMSQTIASGNMKQAQRTYNFQTLNYTQNNDVQNPAAGTKTSGAGPDSRVPQKMKDAHNSEPNKISIVPTNNEKQLGSGSNPNIASTSPTQMAYAEALGSSVVKMSIYGDSDLKAGVMITANLLQKLDQTTTPGTDKSQSGDFLISALRHKVKDQGSRPRYTCEMELVKGGNEESFQ